MSTLVELLKHLEGSTDEQIEKLRSGRFRVFEVAVGGESSDRTGDHLKAFTDILMEIRRAVALAEGDSP